MESSGDFYKSREDPHGKSNTTCCSKDLGLIDEILYGDLNEKTQEIEQMLTALTQRVRVDRKAS